MIGDYKNLSDGLKSVKKVLINVSKEVTGMLEVWNDIPAERMGDLLDVAQNAIKTSLDVQDIIDDIYEEEHPDE